MGLLKKVETKKPLSSRQASGGGQISSQRPVQAPKAPPCNGICPSGNDVRGWLTVVAQREKLSLALPEALDAAFMVAAETNPFPSVMGRICPAPCEGVCNRKEKDEAVSIAQSERWIGDWALQRDLPLPKVEGAIPRTEKVAVVGAGLSGLSCAYQLARRGYPVDLYEAGTVAGGTLRSSVPGAKLPPSVLDAEIGRVLALGVTFHPGCRLGGDLSLPELQGSHAAVVLAVGTESPSGPSGANGANEAAGGAAGTADGWGRTAVAGLFFAGSDAEVAAGSVAAGRRAALALDAFLRGTELAPAHALPTIGPERIKKSAYAAIPRTAPNLRTPEAQTADPLLEQDMGFTEEQLLTESSRCFSCGMCFDCEKCWMFCQNECFSKVPAAERGKYYRMVLDACIGCKKCAAVCPSGFLDWV